ncbi:MAG: DUF1501 domain-containing protein, partial [Planctomycetales bacterium]
MDSHASDHHRHSRRRFLASGAASASFLTPLAHVLAQQADKQGEHKAQSLIVLWLGGGASQLETFDPHPGTEIARGSKAIKTSLPGVQVGVGLEQVAASMESISLVRSVVSREGDHERGTKTIKTGYRPDPTADYPYIGAILCHELPQQARRVLGGTEIPRHVSIQSNQWPGRGGFLGDQFDAFKMWDPANPVPDVKARVDQKHFNKRIRGLDVMEKAFAQKRSKRVARTMHRQTITDARAMMSSEQLKQFRVEDEPLALRKAYGETPFGRGCLAARKLVQVGVRCVEVGLGGWDSHANNHSIQANLVSTLDPAFAALIQDLKDHDLFDRVIVLCIGEFGRTPWMNPALGRDHWPHGFSLAIGGGGIRGGTVLGA